MAEGKKKTPTFWSEFAGGIKEIGIAFKEGDFKTRISYVVMGFGQFLRGQWLKGIVFLALEILFFFYMGSRDIDRTDQKRAVCGPFI